MRSKKSSRAGYGVAIIGCGHMGDAHIADIYEKDNVRMVCACDADREKAAQFQKKYGFRRITADAQECINAPDVDIVIIATYPSTHLCYLRMCLDAGKHVLCEKPICVNESEANEFMRLVKSQQQCKVLIGLILRHNESYKRIADMIRQGVIGSPIVFRMVQNHHTMDWPRYLNLIRETSPIIDCGVHYLDVMRWFTDSRITRISGIGLTTEADVPDDKYNYGMITVQLNDGSIGYYEAGWGNSITSDNRKEFIGPLGSIRLIQQKDRTDHQEEGDLIEHYDSRTSEYHMINIPTKRKPTGDQLEHLIRMVEENIPAIPSMDEVLDSFRWALAADRAIRQQNDTEKEENASAKVNNNTGYRMSS